MDKSYYYEPTPEEARKYFLIHLIVYIVVNAMLFVINMVVTPQFPWFVFPLAGWGIGIICHYLYYSKTVREAREEATTSKSSQ